MNKFCFTYITILTLLSAASANAQKVNFVEVKWEEFAPRGAKAYYKEFPEVEVTKKLAAQAEIIRAQLNHFLKGRFFEDEPAHSLFTIDKNENGVLVFCFHLIFPHSDSFVLVRKEKENLTFCISNIWVLSPPISAPD